MPVEKSTVLLAYRLFDSALDIWGKLKMKFKHGTNYAMRALHTLIEADSSHLISKKIAIAIATVGLLLTSFTSLPAVQAKGE